jgi:GNAT superfamily N-acetyltransferase
MEPVVVRPAEPRDAFAVAALHLQAEREDGRTIPPGFLDTLADAWLRDRARSTWLALDAGQNPVGTVHGTLVHTLPSPSRDTTAWMHVGFLFVSAGARGAGLGTRLMETVLDWCSERGVDRVQLHALEAARPVYERLGFGPPSERLVELRLSDRSRRRAG